MAHQGVQVHLGIGAQQDSQELPVAKVLQAGLGPQVQMELLEELVPLEI